MSTTGKVRASVRFSVSQEGIWVDGCTFPNFGRGSCTVAERTDGLKSTRTPCSRSTRSSCIFGSERFPTFSSSSILFFSKRARAISPSSSEIHWIRYFRILSVPYPSMRERLIFFPFFSTERRNDSRLRSMSFSTATSGSFPHFFSDTIRARIISPST